MPGWAADRIVLRNLTVISDGQVASFDEDGVRLADGRILTWDEIERGSLDGQRQAEFDRLLGELGAPLYRIRQRLKVGDYRGLLVHAEALYPRYSQRRGRTAYMVSQSLMWGRLAAGRREGAVEPYLRCYSQLSSDAVAGSDVPGNRRLRFDRDTALSPELTPIWFDAEAAKQAMPGVLRAVAAMQKPYPEGARIYYATLALTAGETDEAVNVLSGVSGRRRATAEWLAIARAQQEIMDGRSGPAVAELESSLDEFSKENKPAALYWLGLSKTANQDEQVRREGTLHLLCLTALYGEAQPELAGAGLYHAMVALDKSNDARGSMTVRKELLLRYAHTVHAARVQADANAAEER